MQSEAMRSGGTALHGEAKQKRRTAQECKGKAEDGEKMDDKQVTIKLKKALFGNENASNEALFKAVLQLKKQTENRALALEELKSVSGAVWLEERDFSGVMPQFISMIDEKYSKVFLSGIGDTGEWGYAIDEYNKDWRLWKEKPSIEDKENTPWSD